jgi:hypothetical protein
MSHAKIAIENVTSPGRVTNVRRDKYEDMQAALMSVLPSDAPGMAVSDAKEAVLPKLSAELFPEGATAGWWLKAVQLDLEAKGVLARSTKPVRLYVTSAS